MRCDLPSATPSRRLAVEAISLRRSAAQPGSSDHLVNDAADHGVFVDVGKISDIEKAAEAVSKRAERSEEALGCAALVLRRPDAGNSGQYDAANA